MDGLSFLALAISSSWYAAAAFMAASSRQRVTARPSPVDGLLIMKALLHWAMRVLEGDSGGCADLMRVR
jgi:hypothetical protein